MDGILMAVTWGSNFLFLKNLLGVFSPLEVTVLRYSITGIFFLLVSGRALKGVRLTWQDFMRLLFSAGIGISLYSVLAAVSMQWLTSSEAGMLNGTIPAITLLVERMIYKRSLIKRQVLAVAVSIFGVILISFGSFSGGFNPLGIGLMLFALVLWVSYGYGIQPLFDRYNNEAINILQSLVGAGLLMPFMLATSENVLVRLWDVKVLLSFLGLSVIASGLGYLYYLKGIRSMGIRKISFYVNLLPVVAVVEGRIFMGDLIRRSHLMGIILVLLSVWIIQRNKEPIMAN